MFDLAKGRIVNVVDTGEKGNTLELYRAPDGRWYSSKEAYAKWNEDRMFRELCIEEVRKQLDYEAFMKLDTLFLKKLKEWKPYGYDVVYDCIKSQADSVEWAMHNKNFPNEKNKIQYISTVYQNHMIDAYKNKQRKIKAEQKRKNTETILINDEINEVVNNKQQATNISKWLED